MKTIESVMHPQPHTIGPEQSLRVAHDIMLQHNIRHLPVQKGGELRGILSDRDINFALRIDHKELGDLKVEDAYTAEPYVVDVRTSLKSVAAHMAKEHIGCALVTRDGELAGIFTTVDACRVLSEVL